MKMLSDIILWFGMASIYIGAISILGLAGLFVVALVEYLIERR